jgi:hypothetical protein
MPKIFTQWNKSSISGKMKPLIHTQIQVEYLQEDIVGELADSDSCERFRFKLACVG